MRPAFCHDIAPALAPALLFCAIAAGLPAEAQSARQPASRLCRVHLEEASTGGDAITMQGVIEISSAAPQADGSGFFMGSGFVDVVLTPAGPNCQVVQGSPYVAWYDAIVSTEDGRTVEVDIFGDEIDFPVTIKCGQMESDYRAGLSYPPTVSMALEDGASATYTESHRSKTFASMRVAGVVRLEFCTPGR
jgi:hypothetical protein